MTKRGARRAAQLAALRALIQKNARRALDQEAYHLEYDALSKRIDAIRERIIGVDRAILRSPGEGHLMPDARKPLSIKVFLQR